MLGGIDTNAERRVNQAAEAVPNEQPPVLEEPRKLPREALVLGAICLGLAVVVRFVNIAHREVFGGEFFTLDFMSGKRPDDLVAALFKGYLPLYYEAIRGWGKAYGVASEFVVRFPSALFGVFACVAFFFYAQRYLRGIAFVVCLLAFALNPTLLAVSNEATPFSLLILWVVLSNYFCIRALDEGGTRNWSLWGIFSMLGALTHPFFWFLLLAQFGFGASRPRKTPRQFLVVSAAGVFFLILLLIAAAVYAEKYLAKEMNPTAPSVTDLARGLVAVTLGNFPRYEYGDRVFILAILYLFVLSTLILSWVYYRKREAEAEALPENVIWVDETQDVVGRWNRLSLASFLMFQWVTFLVPALCIMVLGGFASGLDLRAEYFLVCLPSLVILIAAGIDAAPGRAGMMAFGILFVVIMAVYDLCVLTDNGMGVKKAMQKLESAEFDPAKDTLLYVTYDGLEKTVERYGRGYPSVKFAAREPIADAQKRLAESVAGKERAFVFYHADLRRLGKSERSLTREWFDSRRREFEVDRKWKLSTAEKTELRIYKRIDPSKLPPDAAAQPR
jgi:hypothetical protein